MILTELVQPCNYSILTFLAQTILRCDFTVPPGVIQRIQDGRIFQSYRIGLRSMMDMEVKRMIQDNGVKWEEL